MPASGKKSRLWRISTPVSPECEDAVGEVLLTLFGEPASIYSDAETQKSIAEVYLRHKPGAAELQELKQQIHKVRRAGLSVPPGQVTLSQLRPADWANSWKRHFKTIEIGRRLLICPTWIKRRPKQNQALVVLDPGLSFGTGQHPTTRFCLEQIVAARRPESRQSFLDVGAGSGILSISAAKLGYHPVQAIDFDPEAVRIGMENARANGVHKLVRIEQRDVAKLRPATGSRYDLICANLIYDLLLQHGRRLTHCLHPSGTLVLAGILRSQFPRVFRAYRELGFRLAARATEGEWQSGAFVRKKHQRTVRSSQRAQNGARKNP